MHRLSSVFSGRKFPMADLVGNEVNPRNISYQEPQSVQCTVQELVIQCSWRVAMANWLGLLQKKTS
jgi:hypothetical protein